MNSSQCEDSSLIITGFLLTALHRTSRILPTP